MIWPLKARPAGRRPHRNDPFTRATHGDLDIVMPPPYEMSRDQQVEALAWVEELLQRVQPGGLDAGSREFLNNLINAWCDEAIARLDAERDERQAVADVLIGLAGEEAARSKPKYDVDLTRALHAREALESALEALTQKRTGDLRESRPPRLDDGPLESTLGELGRIGARTSLVPEEPEKAGQLAGQLAGPDDPTGHAELAGSGPPGIEYRPDPSAALPPLHTANGVGIPKHTRHSEELGHE
jgi:hypothetical protein